MTVEAEKTIFVVFGNMGHGKTTFAEMLANLMGGKIMSFADSVKQVAKDMVGIPLEVSFGTQDDKANNHYYGKSARHWLQLIGTEMGRDYVSKTVWVDRFIDRAFEDPNRVIISGDGRFPDQEYLYLKKEAEKRGAYVCGVVIRRPGQAVDLSHSSESVIAETPDYLFDAVIENDADLVALERAAEVLINNVAPFLLFTDGVNKIEPIQEPAEGRVGNYIWLQSGRPFWPLDPRPEDFILEDIAHGASQENRWHGQTMTPVNVANHSNNVRKLAMVIAPVGLKALAGLYAQLHDGHEGLLKDIAKPLKEMFPEWASMEKAVDLAIYKHFGLDPVIPEEIKVIVETCDMWMAGVEARSFHCLEKKDLDRLKPVPNSIIMAANLTLNQIPEEDKEEFICATKLLLRECSLPYHGI